MVQYRKKEKIMSKTYDFIQCECGEKTFHPLHEFCSFCGEKIRYKVKNYERDIKAIRYQQSRPCWGLWDGDKQLFEKSGDCYNVITFRTKREALEFDIDYRHNKHVWLTHEEWRYLLKL
jgi:ribosomal protein L37E